MSGTVIFWDVSRALQLPLGGMSADVMFQRINLN